MPDPHHIVRVKPLSVNEAWLGRRRKSAAYRTYEVKVPSHLPELDIPSRGPLALSLRIGVSNRASDIDNPVKPFTDILSRHYGFNDNRIYHLEVVKYKVEKGEEFISFDLTGLATEPTNPAPSES